MQRRESGQESAAVTESDVRVFAVQIFVGIHDRLEDEAERAVSSASETGFQKLASDVREALGMLGFRDVDVLGETRRLQFGPDEIADWAGKKQVQGHLTEGRADPNKYACAGRNCLIAQAVADYFRVSHQS